MTTSPELSTAEAAKVAEFDAAPEPPEIVVERVARALWLDQAPLIPSPWDEISETTRERYRGKARTAIAALDPS